ncbi:DUF4381 domain-containing protein [Paraflavitalea pollutisoli]|uniref:DUF4381 domain-containing protein n=1 Tax=Paraflavitalea pollutisoli TaxID=3034143 RepID=UPI0023EDF129|nr:DUF4381 domain-containing protein [Paraflavitalea sp. H1-2-19X]
MDDYGSLIEPAPVTFSFGAPGWYVLAIAVILLLAIITGLFIRRYQRNQYRRHALAWLRLREQELQQSDTTLLVYETNMLLKRVAMRQYGRSPIAAIRGDAWINLLNQTMNRSLFTVQEQDLLQQVLYQPQRKINTADAANFVAHSKNWLQHHRHHYAF